MLISSEIVNQFITLFSEFENLLSCNFAKIEIAQVASQLPKSPVTQVSVNIRSDNINSLNEREYKIFIKNLHLSFWKRMKIISISTLYSPKQCGEKSGVCLNVIMKKLLK